MSLFSLSSILALVKGYHLVNRNILQSTHGACGPSDLNRIDPRLLSYSEMAQTSVATQIAGTEDPLTGLGHFTGLDANPRSDPKRIAFFPFQLYLNPVAPPGCGVAQ